MIHVAIEKGLSEKQVEKIKNDPVLNSYIDLFGEVYFKIDKKGKYILINPKYINEKTTQFIEIKGEDKND